MKGCLSRIFIVVLLVLSIGLIIYSFYLLSILTEDTPTDANALKFEVLGRTLRFDSYTGQVGDAIGGLLNPFIGMSAIIVTGLAFYMQYQANDMVRKQFELQKFETQFYERLRLHKENVNEMEIEKKRCIFEKSKIIKGRTAFYKILEDLERRIKSNNDINSREEFQKKIYSEFYKDYGGYISHYFRHLFHTVKFVIVSKKKKIINEEEKKEYLQILRAQMSNDEQKLLFYNWLAPDYGGDWEYLGEDNNGEKKGKKNSFFTEHKMLHNLWYKELYGDGLVKPKLKELVEKYEKQYKKGKKDCLFEQEDEYIKKNY